MKKWLRRRPYRTVTAYVGTDHALTDPAALTLMQDDGVDVRLMNVYRGIFHPKVVWLAGRGSNVVWVGSNNLTKDGLLNNIEFAVVIEAKATELGFTQWVDAVAAGSTPLTSELLNSYRAERQSFEKKRATAKDTTFTWSRKREPAKRPPSAQLRKGDLILEIMPEETRGGTQVQFPKAAANAFFGLAKIGQHKTIHLRRRGGAESRELIITVFSNSTVRVSVSELEYRDRPCVIVFRKSAGDRVTFDIVPESIFPSRYRDLIRSCVNQTRTGSRRWAIR